MHENDQQLPTVRATGNELTPSSRPSRATTLTASADLAASHVRYIRGHDDDDNDCNMDMIGSGEAAADGVMGRSSGGTRER